MIMLKNVSRVNWKFIYVLIWFMQLLMQMMGRFVMRYMRNIIQVFIDFLMCMFFLSIVMRQLYIVMVDVKFVNYSRRNQRVLKSFLMLFMLMKMFGRLVQEKLRLNFCFIYLSVVVLFCWRILGGIIFGVQVVVSGMVIELLRIILVNLLSEIVVILERVMLFFGLRQFVQFWMIFILRDSVKNICLVVVSIICQRWLLRQFQFGVQMKWKLFMVFQFGLIGELRVNMYIIIRIVKMYRSGIIILIQCLIFLLIFWLIVIVSRIIVMFQKSMIWLWLFRQLLKNFFVGCLKQEFVVLKYV